MANGNDVTWPPLALGPYLASASFQSALRRMGHRLMRLAPDVGDDALFEAVGRMIERAALVGADEFLRGFPTESHLLAYIDRSARRAVPRVRARVSGVSITPGDPSLLNPPDVVEQLVDRETWERVGSLFRESGAQSEMDRRMVALFLSGRTQSQIADILGVNRSTVSRRWRRLVADIARRTGG